MKVIKFLTLVLCLTALVACAGKPRQKKVESSVATFSDRDWKDVSKFRLASKDVNVSKAKERKSVAVKSTPALEKSAKSAAVNCNLVLQLFAFCVTI